MFDNTFENRIMKVTSFWKNDETLYVIVAFVLGFVISPVITSSQDLLDSLFPEFMGIAFTVLIIDRLAVIRERTTYKTRLLEQLSSRTNSIAINAAEQLWANDWWTDDTFVNMRLVRADLRGVDFGKANLTGVIFSDDRYGSARFDANTILPDETAWTEDSDLDQFTNPAHPNYWRGYGLRGKDLTFEDFSNANLLNADIRDANLRHADFNSADLRGSRFENAKTDNMDLTGAKFNNKTILPDGKPWTSNDDWKSFNVVI